VIETSSQTKTIILCYYNVCDYLMLVDLLPTFNGFYAVFTLVKCLVAVQLYCHCSVRASKTPDKENLGQFDIL